MEASQVMRMQIHWELFWEISTNANALSTIIRQGKNVAAFYERQDKEALLSNARDVRNDERFSSGTIGEKFYRHDRCQGRVYEVQYRRYINRGFRGSN